MYIASEERLLQITYSIIELVNRQELRTTSKKLIINYIKESLQVHHAAKAREAIERYTNEELPDLEELRSRFNQHGIEALNEVDHLLLRLEHEGKFLDA
ncbi:hypothetical protein B4O97_06320 [Marispirochaeta aestuarii]|uniref:Uncharacterized protein n=1 Tax=Marispirochaeta aestuarii TaxID=1963862 RepID=A0A1Y1RZE1_9SPIO|nr:hypothetical protein [Marispirochaeta aestuarii]ORC36202.1 hypothetical protein B4O97_06320 [Marispirochaeta aestuarii]